MQPVTSLSLSMRVGQRRMLRATPLNDQGNWGRTIAPPSWTWDNVDVIMVDAAPDGLTAVIRAVGPGTSIITITLPRPLGPQGPQGPPPVPAKITITVGGDLATVVSVSAEESMGP